MQSHYCTCWVKTEGMTCKTCGLPNRPRSSGLDQYGCPLQHRVHSEGDRCNCRGKICVWDKLRYEGMDEQEEA